MDINFDTIFVFATNIKTKTDKRKVSTVLDKNLSINQWSIDQEDIDCVLRIDTNTLSSQDIITLITSHNFNCTELE